MLLRTRTLVMLLAAASLLSCGSDADPAPPETSGAAEAPGLPHVVFLILDTLRADALGSYGSPLGTSPELDFLAQEGVRFERVVSQASWTRPSVGSLLTSRYPRSLGIHTLEEGALAPEQTTLAEVLQAAGYRTIGATANPHLNPVFGFHQGFEQYLPSNTLWSFMEQGDSETPPPPRGAVGSLATARTLFTQVLAQLKAGPADQRQRPHYLQFDLMDAHEHFPQNQQIRPEYRSLFPTLRRQGPVRLYHQAVRQLSADVRWFLQELMAIPGFEDVLVVLVSDHGEGLESHPDVPFSKTHGQLLYESQMMVPWILYHTGSLLPRGTVVQRPVRLLEVMPTLLDLLGLAAPAGLQGRSVLDLVRQDPPPGGSTALPEHFVVETRGFDRNKLGVYGPDWKYLENRDGHDGLPEVELQPYGLENGAATDQSIQHPDLTYQYRSILLDWEEQFPRAAPTPLWGEDQDHTFDLLKQLGYMDR